MLLENDSHSQGGRWHGFTKYLCDVMSSTFFSCKRVSLTAPSQLFAYLRRKDSWDSGVLYLFVTDLKFNDARETHLAKFVKEFKVQFRDTSNLFLKNVLESSE